MPNEAERRGRIESLLRRREADAAAAKRRERGFVALGFTVAGLGIVATSAAADGLIPINAWISGVLFVALLGAAIALREMATKQRLLAVGACAWLRQGLARLDDHFDFGQDDGRAYLDESHPFAGDLDLFGTPSLFQRANSTGTTLGRDSLAALLREETPSQTMADRQESITELADDLESREKLEHLLIRFRERSGRNAADRADFDARTRDLLVWATEPPPPRERPHHLAGKLLLSAFTLTALGLWAFGGFSAGLFTLSYLVSFAVLGRRKEVQELLERFEGLERTLSTWADFVRFMEERPHRSMVLQSLARNLSADGMRASAAVRKFSGLVSELAQRRNVFWAMTGDVILLWDLHVVRRIGNWQRRHGANLKIWLETVASFEALASLGTLADALTDHTLPVSSGEDPILAAEGMAHPLLPRSSRVANDLLLPSEGMAHLITGSNMSGKSTYLRAAGLLVVMARLGLPVAARSCRLRPMSVVTSMRIQDSLGRGSSRFHAEVQRLSSCLAIVRREPLTLVLLDEILGGTNSEERHAGTLAVLRSLVTSPAISLIATHDLKLTDLAKEFPDRVHIGHFRDLIENGQMTFDYTYRDGPCPTTNALRVLHQAGLDVPLPP